MPSKLVTDRQKSANYLLALEDTQVPAVTAALAVSYFPGASSASGTSLTPFIKALLARLRADLEALIAADVANESEQLDDVPLREARDASADALYARALEIRELLSAVYGPNTARDLGFSGQTPRDPVVLVRLAADVAARLRDPAALPAPRFSTLTWDPTSAAQVLETGRTQLTQHLDTVARETREAQVTQATKDRAMAAYDRTFTQVATFLSALFTLAGQDDLATRIRPSAHRPGRLPDELIEPSATPALPDPAPAA